MAEKILCRVLTGPTASGKSALAMRLAREEGWEIICMDSMQIYRRMDIGTAKPTPDERLLIPHHMLDIREPNETFSVSEYVEEAERTVKRLYSEGRQFLFVGGTGLYLQAMMHPMGMGSIPADEKLRKELNGIANKPGGKEALHERLMALDSDTAKRLPLNDVRRIIRAIEVTEKTGIPFSRQPDRAEESWFEWRTVSIEMDRSLLYKRINERVEEMIRLGLKDEVAGLLESGVPENAQSMQAIGYKEMIPCVKGFCSLDQAAETIRTNSRHYAKRQMTFLRREESVCYVNTQYDSAYEQIRKILK